MDGESDQTTSHTALLNIVKSFHLISAVTKLFLVFLSLMQCCISCDLGAMYHANYYFDLSNCMALLLWCCCAKFSIFSYAFPVHLFIAIVPKALNFSFLKLIKLGTPSLLYLNYTTTKLPNYG